jgi:transcriptional antiterminator
MDIRIIIKLHDCLNNGCTGNPKELSEKLGVSERTLYNYISFMKNELRAPVAFNVNKRSYEYFGECVLRFENK